MQRDDGGGSGGRTKSIKVNSSTGLPPFLTDYRSFAARDLGGGGAGRAG